MYGLVSKHGGTDRMPISKSWRLAYLNSTIHRYLYRKGDSLHRRVPCSGSNAICSQGYTPSICDAMHQSMKVGGWRQDECVRSLVNVRVSVAFSAQGRSDLTTRVASLALVRLPVMAPRSEARRTEEGNAIVEARARASRLHYQAIAQRNRAREAETKRLREEAVAAAATAKATAKQAAKAAASPPKTTPTTTPKTSPKLSARPSPSPMPGAAKGAASRTPTPPRGQTPPTGGLPRDAPWKTAPAALRVVSTSSVHGSPEDLHMLEESLLAKAKKAGGTGAASWKRPTQPGAHGSSASSGQQSVEASGPVSHMRRGPPKLPRIPESTIEKRLLGKRTRHTHAASYVKGI